MRKRSQKCGVPIFQPLPPFVQQTLRGILHRQFSESSLQKIFTELGDLGQASNFLIYKVGIVITTSELLRAVECKWSIQPYYCISVDICYYYTRPPGDDSYILFCLFIAKIFSLVSRFKRYRVICCIFWNLSISVSQPCNSPPWGQLTYQFLVYLARSILYI